MLAVANLVMALRGDLPPRESADPKAILLILGGLAALIALDRPRRRIHPGDRDPVRGDRGRVRPASAFLTDLRSASCSPSSMFLIFDKLLTLSLPSGPLERLL